MAPKVLYKFKSLSSEPEFEYVLDILQNFRLYSPCRSQVNDPFEGLNIDFFPHVAGSGYHYIAGVLHPIVIELFDRYRFTSFSEEVRNPILWAYYASNYSGVCFEFSTSNSLKDVVPIEYSDNTAKSIGEEEMIKSEQNILKQALSVKSKYWEYEKEWRLFNDVNSEFVTLGKDDIKSLILGPFFDMKKHSKIIKLAEKNGLLIRKAQPICPTRKIEFLPYKVRFPFEDGSYNEVMFTDL